MAAIKREANHFPQLLIIVIVNNNKIIIVIILESIVDGISVKTFFFFLGTV